MNAYFVCSRKARSKTEAHRESLRGKFEKPKEGLHSVATSQSSLKLKILCPIELFALRPFGAAPTKTVSEEGASMKTAFNQNHVLGDYSVEIFAITLQQKKMNELKMSVRIATWWIKD